MKIAIAVSTLLLFCPAPVSAATYWEQQMCLTWISIAGHFGPEGDRESFAKQYSTLYDKAAKRTDVDPVHRSTDEQIAMERYTEWAAEYAKASASDPAEAARMVERVMPAALGCAAVVTDDKLDSEASPELHDLLNGEGGQGLGGAPI